MQSNNSDTDSTVVIRTLHPTENEIEQCYNITRSVFKEYGRPEEFINKYMIEQDMSDIEENYLKLPRSHWWVAAIGQKIIGQVGVQPMSVGDRVLYNKLMKDESTWFYKDIHPDEICELRRMAVLSDYQNQHIGRSLLQKLIDFARTHDYKGIHLTTIIVLNLACRFYERSGFIRGQIHRYTIDLDGLIAKDKKNIAVDSNKTDKIATFLGTPVIFNSLNELTDDDWEQINQPMLMMQMKSRYFYAQHFWMKL
jgi:GNAT superfamily N-acetyltransferase